MNCPNRQISFPISWRNRLCYFAPDLNVRLCKVRSSIIDRYTGNCSLDISEADVYGGGNKADYKPTNANTDDYPEVNIKNATVKSVFGGGLQAEVKGNPHINIKKGSKILGNVYGGGNMGKVTGNPSVIINGKQTN